MKKQIKEEHIAEHWDWTFAMTVTRDREEQKKLRRECKEQVKRNQAVMDALNNE